MVIRSNIKLGNMTDLVFKGRNDQVLTNSLKDFIETMYPDLGDCIKLYEDCYTKCIICADGSVLTQLELADSLIEYALLGNFDKAVVVNSYLFGDRKMLHYAILKTMAEVLSNPPKNCKNRSTYLMKDKNTGLVKIGSSSDISVRIQTLSCGNPYLYWLFLIKT